MAGVALQVGAPGIAAFAGWFILASSHIHPDITFVQLEEQSPVTGWELWLLVFRHINLNGAELPHSPDKFAG
jgi:hypothetical protein